MEDLGAGYDVGRYVCDCAEEDEVSADVGREGGVLWFAYFPSPEVDWACEGVGGDYLREAEGCITQIVPEMSRKTLANIQPQMSTTGPPVCSPNWKYEITLAAAPMLVNVNAIDISSDTFF